MKSLNVQKFTNVDDFHSVTKGIDIDKAEFGLSENGKAKQAPVAFIISGSNLNQDEVFHFLREYADCDWIACSAHRGTVTTIYIEMI